MKKIITLALFSGLVLNLFSQQNKKLLLSESNSFANFIKEQKVNFNTSFSEVDIEASRSLEARDTTYVLYLKKFVDKEPCTLSDSAKLEPWGGNFYQETGKGQVYLVDFPSGGYDSAKINSLWAKLFVYKNGTPNLSITARVYEYDTANGGNVAGLLGTSRPVLLSAIQANPLQNFAFASPVAVPSHGFVFLSVSMPPTDADQTILYSTPAGCSPNPLRSWESFQYQGSDVWMPITYTWSPDSGMLNGPSVYFHLFPEVSFFKSIEVKSAKKEILTFNFDGLTPPVKGVVWDSLVTLEVPFGTSLTDLVATFTLKDSASLSVGGTAQISGQTANSFASPVSYLITAEDGSTKTYVVTVDVLAGISNQAVSNLSMAPNPVKNTLNLSFNASESTVLVKLLSVTGQVIYNDTFYKNNDVFKASIDFNNINSGVYFLQLNTKAGVLVKKIVKY